MSSYHYERGKYFVDSLNPLSEAELDACVAELEARDARWSKPRKRRLNPAWNADDVVERFGGPLGRSLPSASTDREA